MLHQITIQTTNLEQFISVIKTALGREAKLLEYSIEHTRKALAPFEARYHMSTDEFERKFKTREIKETLDFLDWWMEVEALRRLEFRRNLIRRVPKGDAIPPAQTLNPSAPLRTSPRHHARRNRSWVFESSEQFILLR